MSEPAIDYSKQLEQARMQQPARPAQFHAPQKADNYPQDSENKPTQHLSNANPVANAHNIKEKLDAVKNATKIATPMGAVSLLGQIDFLGDMPYAVAMGAAILKDLTDLVDAETVILPALFAAFCSIVIFMMMLLARSNGKGKAVKKFMQKGMLVLGGGIVDAIPGLDFLPIETVTVCAVYVMTLLERKNSSN